jgi:hypothetical protein
MIYYITNSLIVKENFFLTRYFELFIYTEIELSINELDAFFEEKSIKLSDGKLILITDELNSNFSYYTFHKDDFRISNNLFELFDLNEKIDVTGVFQRLSGPDYNNYGSRTIFENIKKTIPSSIYKFESNSVKIEPNCQLLNYDLNKLTNTLIEEIEQEIIDFNKKRYGAYPKIHIALSGGLDSRLSLYALMKTVGKSKIRVITYGADSSEDVKIAKKISRIFGLDFKLFWNESFLWPRIEDFQFYKKVGGFGISVWNVIKRLGNFEKTDILVLGDLFEIIVSRKLNLPISRIDNFKIFKKKRKINNFVNDPIIYLSNNILAQIKNVDLFKKAFLDMFGLEYNVSNIMLETQNDLNDWFEIIQRRKLQSAQILEYFTLFKYGCPEYRNQLHTVNCFVECSSISENIKLINLIVSVNPLERQDNKLFNELFKGDPLWSKLMSIPRASAPLLPAKFSNKQLVNLIKTLRFIKDEIYFKLEKKFPKKFESRWNMWRKIYKEAESRDTKFLYNQEYEDLLLNKSKFGNSRPIPNYSFVNFESLISALKNYENTVHRSN